MVCLKIHSSEKRRYPCTMNRKGYVRKQSWSNWSTMSEYSRSTEENHKNSQSGSKVSRARSNRAPSIYKWKALPLQPTCPFYARPTFRYTRLQLKLASYNIKECFWKTYAFHCKNFISMPVRGPHNLLLDSVPVPRADSQAGRCRGLEVRFTCQSPPPWFIFRVKISMTLRKIYSELRFPLHFWAVPWIWSQPSLKRR
jgi:hypothetical protein